jgi:acyl carrier protein
VPSLFVPLDALPRNPNGKLDRAALPEPTGGREGLGVPYVAPRNAVETAIVELWRGRLGIEEVGIYDNFFDLGGSSLQMAQLHGELQERLERRLTMVDLFRFPTVATLARFVGEGRHREGDADPGEHRERAEDRMARLRRRREMRQP